MEITVFIRYRLDPFQRDAFEAYARRWLEIIPRCGGELVGYWMPHEGTNDVAFGLITSPASPLFASSPLARTRPTGQGTP